MTREEKAQIIEELTQKFTDHNYFYVTDASGLSVAQINKFRRLCFEKGVEYKVLKNTLIAKALENLDVDFSEFTDKALKGFSGVLFSDTGNLPAKILLDFRKTGTDKPLLKGASIDTAFYFGDATLDSLGKLKSKNEVIGDIIGLLQSPAKNVLSALQSGGNTIAGLVKTLSEKPE